MDDIRQQLNQVIDTATHHATGPAPVELRRRRQQRGAATVALRLDAGIALPNLLGRWNPSPVTPTQPTRVRQLACGDITFPETGLFAPPGAEQGRDPALARLRREFAGTTVSPRPHADVRNLQRVADLPALLGALVALVALGTVTHALVTSVRRRRRDLAVLKTLGLVRGQVAATIAWQATTFAVVALGLGLPLGIAGGRWAWQLTAAALGVASGPVVPLLAIAAAAVGMVLAVNLVAAFPGWAAGRLRPATVLRSE
jgi:hypothetical protein